MTRLAMLLLLFAAVPALADQRILDVSDAAGVVTLIRDGRARPVVPFAGLEPGDELRVRGPGAFVVIGGGGETVRIDEEHSPYRVPEPGRPSAAGNAVSEAIRAFERLVANPEQTATVLSRGDPAAAPQLRCLGGVEHLVPAGLPVRAFWINGRSPYAVTLTGPAGAADARTLEVTAAESPGLVASGELAAGVYRLAVTDGTGTRARAPAVFQVVPPAALPAPVREVLAAGLPGRAGDRLAAALLEPQAPWRYAAVLFAARAEDQALLAGLLARVCK